MNTVNTINNHAPEPDTMSLLGTIRSTGESVSVRAPLADLPTVLESLERFLRACGYQFDGVLDIIDEDTLQSTLNKEPQP